jgi:hypothetical protein
LPAGGKGREISLTAYEKSRDKGHGFPEVSEQWK